MIALFDFLMTHRIQILSIIGSILLVLFILRLIKRKKLKEEYSLLWLGLGSIFILVSIFRPLLDIFAQTVGIIYAPAALLLMLIVSAFMILIQYSIVISKISDNNKSLIQEVGILKAELEKVKSALKEKP